MFCPGETISFSFIVPFYKDDLSKVIVSFKAKGDIFYEKVITSKSAALYEYFTEEIKDKKETGRTIIKFRLEQEESLLFPEDMNYEIQMNVLTYGGSRHACKLIKRKEHYQHIQDVMVGGFTSDEQSMESIVIDDDYEIDDSSIVKQAYYAVFGYSN